MSENASKPSLAARETPRIVHSEAGYAIGTWEHHVIVVWRHEISVPGVANWSRAMGELHKERPSQRINVLAYVEPECAFGGSPVTFAACVEALKRFQDAVAATAVVYNREGFWNATMRGRVTAIHSESKTDLPYALHPSLASAIAWLGENGASETRAEPAALTRAVESVRAA